MHALCASDTVSVTRKVLCGSFFMRCIYKFSFIHSHVSDGNLARKDTGSVISFHPASVAALVLLFCQLVCEHFVVLFRRRQESSARPT